MSQNYLKIQIENLEKAYARSAELASALPARAAGERFHFVVFGEECTISREGVMLGGAPATGPEGILVAMYANSVRDLPVRLHPLQAFKELPGSMPYHGAFHTNSERSLVPYVDSIQIHQKEIAAKFSGQINLDATSGDFSFTLYPLPRVPLYYIFNLSDEEFPASAICLFAANALEFMPLAGLADTAEYTAKKVIKFVEDRQPAEDPLNN